MDTISIKKVLISYVITSLVIFFVSAAVSISGILGNSISSVWGHLSIELIAIIQFTIVSVSNLVLHMVFYYGGFASSPLVRGLGIGAFMGLAYFLIGVLALDLYDVNTDTLQQLIGAMSGRIIEYSAGGIAMAVISVSDIHRWGLLRAF